MKTKSILLIAVIGLFLSGCMGEFKPTIKQHLHVSNLTNDIALMTAVWYHGEIVWSEFDEFEEITDSLIIVRYKQAEEYCEQIKDRKRINAKKLIRKQSNKEEIIDSTNNLTELDILDGTMYIDSISNNKLFYLYGSSDTLGFTYTENDIFDHYSYEYEGIYYNDYDASYRLITLTDILNYVEYCYSDSIEVGERYIYYERLHEDGSISEQSYREIYFYVNDPRFEPFDYDNLDTSYIRVEPIKEPHEQPTFLGFSKWMKNKEK